VGHVAGLEPDPTHANDSASARTLVCTHLGTPRANVLSGTDGSEVMCGLGGNDSLNGGQSTDVCVQGPGSGPRISCEH